MNNKYRVNIIEIELLLLLIKDIDTLQLSLTPAYF
jgi:hypothetical protein